MNDDREDRERENFKKKMYPTLPNGLSLFKKMKNESDILFGFSSNVERS